MKIFTFIATGLVIVSCNQQNGQVQKMQATHYAFNVVTVPVNRTVVNQDFKQPSGDNKQKKN